MKNCRTPVKQRGFFDLGLGLGLMLVFGGTAAVVDGDKELENQIVKPQTEIVQEKVVVVKSEQ